MSTRQELTRLLKQAERIQWYHGLGDHPDHVTFGYVYRHPEAANWERTGVQARILYLNIQTIVGRTCHGWGPTLTAYQRRVLDDTRILD